MTSKKQRIQIDSVNNLKKILDENGMSQIELADIALDGNAQLVNKIVKGQKPGLSLAVAMKIAEALNTPIEMIFSINKAI